LKCRGNAVADRLSFSEVDQDPRENDVEDVAAKINPRNLKQNDCPT
jgi:hypothetical protein